MIVCERERVVWVSDRETTKGIKRVRRRGACMRERERILLRNISATMSTGTVTWDLLIALIDNHVSEKQHKMHFKVETRLTNKVQPLIQTSVTKQ